MRDLHSPLHDAWSVNPAAVCICLLLRGDFQRGRSSGSFVLLKCIGAKRKEYKIGLLVWIGLNQPTLIKMKVYNFWLTIDTRYRVVRKNLHTFENYISITFIIPTKLQQILCNKAVSRPPTQKTLFQYLDAFWRNPSSKVTRAFFVERPCLNAM